MKATRTQNYDLIRLPLIGVGISVAVMLCFTAFAALLLDQQKMDIAAMGLVSCFIQFLAALSGGAVAARGERRLLKGIITGTGYLLTLICANALFLDGTYSGILLSAGTIALGSILPALINNLTKKRSQRGRRKKQKW